MNHFSRFAANAYASTGVATGTASASPHQLTLMLYDAALTHIGRAEASLVAGNVAEKGMAVSRAIRIIEEGLMASLDVNAGGELAHNLKALYEYITRCLLKGNVRNDRAPIAEARGLLEGMRNTWAEIGPVVDRPPAGAYPTVNRAGAMGAAGMSSASAYGGAPA